jgi:hypothetical protein
MIERWVIILLCLMTIARPVSAQFRWDKREVDLNPGVLDTNVVTRFQFENIGNKTIAIRSVRSSCGCTTVAQDKKSYKPREKGEIIADFPFGQRLGVQEKKILVETDDSTESIVILTFRVHIKELVRLEPSMLLWRVGEKAAPKVINVKVFSSEQIDVVGAKVGDSRFVTELRPVKKGVEYTISVKPTTTAQPAVSVVEVETNYPKEKPRTFRAYALVK